MVYNINSISYKVYFIQCIPVYTGVGQCTRWYKTVSRSGVRAFYLVSSSSPGVVIPSICSPFSDLKYCNWENLLL